MSTLLIEIVDSPAFVAMAVTGRIADLVTFDSGTDRTEMLDHAIRTLRDQNPHDFACIETIIVGAGPGNFTAIRIAIAYARALSWSLGVPSCGVSLLDLDAVLEPHAQNHLRQAYADFVFWRDQTGLVRLVPESALDAPYTSPHSLARAKIHQTTPHKRAQAMLACHAQENTQTPAQALYFRDANATPAQQNIPKILPE